MTRQIPDYVGEHFAAHKVRMRYVIPAITCKDGFTYSVQASSGHYCTPRNDEGPWTSFEVWGLNKDGKHWRTEPEGWVSRGTINRRIHRHGGVAE